MDGFILLAIILVASTLIIAGIFLYIRKKNKSVDESIANATKTRLMHMVEEIEITNHDGEKLVLTKLDSSTAISTRKFQEITARVTTIGHNIVQGSLPALAKAQTLDEIKKIAPNGLFTTRGSISELMKYKDGTTSSIIKNGDKFAGKAGFQEIVPSGINPAVIIGVAIQTMAMVSGLYYMAEISKQLDEIKRDIEKLIEFHHDTNVGILRSIENRIKEIIGKKYVDETDIIALQSGIHEADSILMEYSIRLERLIKTGKLTDVQVSALRSRWSVSKELKNLRVNAGEHYYSFQIYIIATKLMLESKKAEFATRMKIGETEKAMEVLESFNSMYQKSITKATKLLDNINKSINNKSEALRKRQWFKSMTKNAKNELKSIKKSKNDLQKCISMITPNNSDKEITYSFTNNEDILYIPHKDGAEPRIFISTREH